MSKLAELDFTDKTLPERWQEVKTNFWRDLKRETVFSLKRLLETTMNIQVQDLVGSPTGIHNRCRRTYRNGFYSRNLLTGLGKIEGLLVPRVRCGRVKTLPRYLRRSADVDQTVLDMFLAGVSTRRVKEVLRPLFGKVALSATTVSRITKQLDRHVRSFHRRSLKDRYRYLIFDGIYLKTKSPLLSKRRCVLVAYGITDTGIRELIDFRMASQGESENAWHSFLHYLWIRGLKAQETELAVVDGNKGLWNALAIVFPSLPRQRCWAHKLRNIANKLPKSIQAPCVSDARKIYRAKTRKDALRQFRHWKTKWQAQASQVVRSLEEDLDDLLTFFQCPENMRTKLRTTNIIERCFREVRRRTKPISCFTNTQSVDRIIYAIFYRQNQLWKDQPLSQFTQNS